MKNSILVVKEEYLVYVYVYTTVEGPIKLFLILNLIVTYLYFISVMIANNIEDNLFHFIIIIERIVCVCACECVCESVCSAGAL